MVKAREYHWLEINAKELLYGYCLPASGPQLEVSFWVLIEFCVQLGRLGFIVVIRPKDHRTKLEPWPLCLPEMMFIDIAWVKHLFSRFLISLPLVLLARHYTVKYLGKDNRLSPLPYGSASLDIYLPLQEHSAVRKVITNRKILQKASNIVIFDIN